MITQTVATFKFTFKRRMDSQRSPLWGQSVPVDIYAALKTGSADTFKYRFGEEPIQGKDVQSSTLSGCNTQQ